MSPGRIFLVLASLGALCSLDACGSDSSGGGGGGGTDASAVGGEGQPCYPNDTCNAGLTCLSKLCVDAGTGGTGGASTGGAGGAAGTGATGGTIGDGSADSGGPYPICDTGLSYDDPKCAECLSANCCSEFKACAGNGEPAQIDACLNDCSLDPPGPLCSSAANCISGSCAADCT